jgi:NagD protein
MDGTIYLGGTLFRSTRRFLALLTDYGIHYTFITNNCSRSRAEYVIHLRAMGIQVETDAIETSAQATVFHLQMWLPRVKRLFVLGTTGLVEDIRQAGFKIVDDLPDAIVVGFDTTLTFDRLARTAYWINQPLPYIATHPDLVCPTDRPTVLPDCGAVCALLQAATGRRPDAIPGKPSPAMLQAVMQRRAIKPSEVAMVGDRLYTDVRMARSAGALAVLTLTGETTQTQLQLAPESDRPDVVVADLDELADLFRNSR